MLPATTLVTVCLLAAILCLVHQTSADINDAQETEDPWTSWRLPTDLVPISYLVMLQPNLTTFNFTGTVYMRLKVARETDRIIFHSWKLHLVPHRTLVKLVPGSQRFTIVEQRAIEKREMYYIRLAQTLTVGSKIDVRLRGFTGIIGTDQKGLYKSSTGLGASKKTMVSTQLEPIQARKMFPCLDEPSLKATFKIRVFREIHHISLSNMARKNVRSGSLINDCLTCVKDIYYQTPRMSTYLVAIAVCNHSYISAHTLNGTQVRLFAPHEWLAEAQYALNVSLTLFDYYTDLFAFQQPIEKLDLLAVFRHRGGMENWGLMVFSQGFLFGRSGVADLIIAHEIAHHWVGNLVTCEWWNDIWLNEGITTYLHILGQTVADSSKSMETEFLKLIAEILQEDSSSYAVPVRYDVSQRKDIEYIFSSYSTYKKGSILVWMLQNVLGWEALLAGLRHLIWTHQYGSIVTDDFWAALQNGSGIDQGSLNLKEAMDTWVLQRGYPLVTVTRFGGQLIASQQRFFMHRVPGTERPHLRPWQIPFTLVTAEAPSEEVSIWIKQAVETLDVPGVAGNSSGWIKGNVGGRGLYRVNYDTNIWMALSQQLLDNHTVFSTSDRKTLLDDAFTLAAANYINYDIPFNLIQYLPQETSNSIWKIIVGHLEHISELMKLEEEYRLLEAYIWTIVQPKVESLGWAVGLNCELCGLRDKLMSLAPPNQTRIDMFLETFRNWKVNKSTSIEAKYRFALFRTAMELGTKEDWDAVWNEYKVYEFDQQLLNALACAPDTDVLERVLWAQPTQIIDAVSKNLHGRLLVWNFVRRHWDGRLKIVRKRINHARTFYQFLRHFDRKIDYYEIRNFFKFKYQDLGQGKKFFNMHIEQILVNIYWKENSMPRLKSWLRDHMRDWALDPANEYPFDV